MSVHGPAGGRGVSGDNTEFTPPGPDSSRQYKPFLVVTANASCLGLAAICTTGFVSGVTWNTGVMLFLMSHRKMAASTLPVLTVFPSNMLSPVIAFKLGCANCLTGAEGFVFKSHSRTVPSLAPVRRAFAKELRCRLEIGVSWAFQYAFGATAAVGFAVAADKS